MSARDELRWWLDQNFGPDDEQAQQLLDAFRAEVISEALHGAAESAAEIHKQCDRLVCSRCEIRRDILDVLRSVADVIGETPSIAAPDFFEPGHTYSDSGKYDWKFRVDTVTTHPEDGERTALGWRYFRGEWEPYAYGEDDFEIHQLVGHFDVTEAGEGQ